MINMRYTISIDHHLLISGTSIPESIFIIYSGSIPFDILEGEKECQSKSPIKKKESF